MILFTFKLHFPGEAGIDADPNFPLPELHVGDFDQFTLDSPGQAFFLTAEDNAFEVGKRSHFANGEWQRRPFLQEDGLHAGLENLKTKASGRTDLQPG